MKDPAKLGAAPHKQTAKASPCTTAPLDTTNFLSCLRYLSRQLEGKNSSPDDALPENVRIHHHCGLGFSSSDIAEVQRNEAGGVTIWANFLGLTDSQSPIPDYLVHEMVRCDDKAQRTRDYFNLFHHRLYELLFVGLQALDLPWAWSGSSDPCWRERIGALLGLMDPVTDSAVTTSLMSALVMRTPSARVVERALEGSLAPFLQTNASLQIQPFCGERVYLDHAYQNQLGLRNHSLGQDCVLGERVTDRSGKLRILVTNLDQAQFVAFSEKGQAHDLLRTQLCLLLDRPIDVELTLELNPQAAKELARKNATLGQGQQIISSQVETRRRVFVKFAPVGEDQGLSLGIVSS